MSMSNIFDPFHLESIIIKLSVQQIVKAPYGGGKCVPHCGLTYCRSLFQTNQNVSSCRNVHLATFCTSSEDINVNAPVLFPTRLHSHVLRFMLETDT